MKLVASALASFQGTLSARKLPPAPAWLTPFCLCPSYWPRKFHLGENSASSWKWSSHIHTALRVRNQTHQSVKKQNKMKQTWSVLSLIRIYRFGISHLLDSPAAVLGVHLPALVSSPMLRMLECQCSGTSAALGSWGNALVCETKLQRKCAVTLSEGPSVVVWDRVQLSLCDQIASVRFSDLPFAQGCWVIFPCFVCSYGKGTLGTNLETYSLHSCHNCGSSKF